MADYLLRPVRHNTAIPFTYSLLCVTLTLISQLYTDSAYLKLGVSAAFALGYSCSTRSGQYLKTGHHIPLSNQLNSSLSYFWWGETYYSVCDPTLFPPFSLPDKFSSLIEFSKNDKKGFGGPKAIARCLTVPPSEDCLTILFNFLVCYPPLPHQPLLSGSFNTTQIDASLHIKPVLDKLASMYGFNPAQLSVHSSIRSGALIALETQPDAVKLRQGCWTTLGGMHSYLRGTLNHASSITQLLHDPSIYSITELQNVYTTRSLNPSLPSSDTIISDPTLVFSKRNES